MLEAEPELTTAAIICIEAWQDLGTCRAIGYGAMGAIPYTAMLEWARERRLDPEARMRLIAALRELDHRWLEKQSKGARP